MRTRAAARAGPLPFNADCYLCGRADKVLPFNKTGCELWEKKNLDCGMHLPPVTSLSAVSVDSQDLFVR